MNRKYSARHIRKVKPLERLPDDCRELEEEFNGSMAKEAAREAES